MGESAPLIAIIGAITSALLALLIAMVVGLRKDFDKRESSMTVKVDRLQECVNQMVPQNKYESDKEKVMIDIRDHDERIIRLEIKVHSSEVGGGR
jgi:hypothetical protein